MSVWYPRKIFETIQSYLVYENLPNIPCNCFRRIVAVNFSIHTVLLMPSSVTLKGVSSEAGSHHREVSGHRHFSAYAPPVPLSQNATKAVTPLFLRPRGEGGGGFTKKAYHEKISTVPESLSTFGEKRNTRIPLFPSRNCHFRT